MNDYLKGAIDTCDSLSVNKSEFLDMIKRATGLLDAGIKKNNYIMKIATKKTNNKWNKMKTKLQAIQISGRSKRTQKSKPFLIRPEILAQGWSKPREVRYYLRERLK